MSTKKIPVVTKDTFESIFEEIKEIELPKFTGVRVMMLPVILGDTATLPEFVEQYKKTFEALCKMIDPSLKGQVGYLTVDEKTIEPDKTHRRQGLHVDGVYNGGVGGWGGGHSGGSWGSVGNGMLTVSNPAGCRAWNKTFTGWPQSEGECYHLADQCPEQEAVLFKPNMVYWVDGLCVHESMPQLEKVDRQFVRLSLPSEGPWFEGYTENPLGIKPTGEILPRRVFMK